MTVIEIVAYILIGLGLMAGAFIFARRPEFWIEFGWRVFVKLRPLIWAYLSKRMSPEDEKRMHECYRRGGEWDYVRKRCK